MRRLYILVAICALGLGGCGKELTAGGFGEVSARATDESGASGPNMATLPMDGPSLQTLPQLGGTVGLTLSVSLIASDGSELPVTNGASAVEISIGSSDQVPLGEAEVPEGVYSTVRLTFSEVAAAVVGLQIGGIPFSGLVEVALGVEPMIVEVPVDVRVDESDPRVIVLQVNSATWLASANILSGVPAVGIVPAPAFRQALQVRVD